MNKWLTSVRMESTITNVPDLPMPALNVKEEHSMCMYMYENNCIYYNFTGIEHAIQTVHHMNVRAKKDNFTIRVHRI